MPIDSRLFRVLAALTVVSMLIPMIDAPTASAVPVTTVAISEPKYGTSPLYVNSLTEFTLLSSDSGAPVSDIWYRWGTNNLTKYEGPFNAVIFLGTTGGAPPIPVDLEGLQTLYYNATGEAQKSIEVYVDHYYPTSQLRIVGLNYTGTVKHVSPDTEFVLSASDTESGLGAMYYKVNNGSYASYTSPFKLTMAGEQTLSYHSEDNLGNSEPDNAITLYLDNQGPTIVIAPGSPKIEKFGHIYISPSTQVTLNLYDISGVSSSFYKIDDGAWTNYSSSFTLTGDGQRTIYARAIDSLGRSSGDKTLVVNVDSTPPMQSVVGHTSSSIKIKEGDSIEFTSNDTGVGESYIRYSLNGGVTWRDYSSPIVLDNSTDITFYAVDTLGNAATSEIISVTVVAPKPWTFYLGIALLIGAVVLLVSTFLPRRNKRSAEQTNESEKKNQNEDIPESKKKAKRKR